MQKPRVRIYTDYKSPYAYVCKVDAEHDQMIWTHPGMTTYYRNGRGRVFSAMPWRFVDYWQMTHDVDLSDYRQTKALG